MGNGSAVVEASHKTSFVGGYLTPSQKVKLTAVATLMDCSIQNLLGRLADQAHKLPAILGAEDDPGTAHQG